MTSPDALQDRCSWADPSELFLPGGEWGDAFLLSKDTVQLEQAAANPIATEAGKTIFEVLTGCQ